MKNSLSLLLIFSCFSFAVAQKMTPEIHFKWTKQTYPVYQQSINKLLFTVKTCPEVHAITMENDIRSLSFVSSCVKTSVNTNEYSFEVILTKNIDVTELKQFLTSVHASEFYFNGNKVYTDDLLTMDEVAAKKALTVNENNSLTITNQSSPEEKRMFNLQNSKAKLNSLYDSNYPRYLFNGSVAAIKDNIRANLEQK